MRKLFTYTVIAGSAAGAGIAPQSVFAQAAPTMKTWEYKEAERKEEDLAVLKQEFKEFNQTGQVVKYILQVSNPIMELVKSLEIERGTDTHGAFEKITKFDEGGEPLLTEKIYMDAAGKLRLRVEFTDYLKNPDEVFTRIHKYTETGKPLGTTTTDSKSTKVGAEEWKYNKENEETRYEKWELQADGNKHTEEKNIEYNPDGTLARSLLVIKENGNELKEEIIFEKNKVKEKKRFKNGEVVSSFGGNKAKYDPNKGKVLVDFGNSDQFEMGMWDVQDEMDDKGRKVKTVKTEGVEVVEEIRYEYDNRDNLIKTKKIFYAAGEPSGQEEEQVWEYDLHNNKLREASYNNGVLMQEKTYAYQYYK